MTFAASAEVVRYQGAIPILVDCDPGTLNLNIEDAMSKLDQLRSGRLAGVSNSLTRDTHAAGIIAVHVSGMMMQIDQLQDFARQEGLWIVEDARCFRCLRNSLFSRGNAWGRHCWRFSFYANKTSTTGEGGMAVTDNADLASRMRMMSLHGLSQDAWDRYSTGGAWDYKIAAPGFKYNLTDIAASIGIHQLARAESMRKERENIARRYLEELADVSAVELPPVDANRIHSWHLFPIKLHLNRLAIDRNAFVEELKRRGVGCSVHWRPLHLHPYYEQAFGWRPESLPVATAVWQRLISLPLFPGMDDSELRHVVDSVADICGRNAR
jgi:perosamine synthetase